MASSQDTSQISALEDSAALTVAGWAHEKTSKAIQRRPLSKGFFFASVLAAVMTPGASSKAADRKSACAAEDLSALVVIEERSEVIDASTAQVVDASRQFLQARRLCVSGQQDEAISLYQNAINTALGFDSTVVIAKARVTSTAAIEMRSISR